MIGPSRRGGAGARWWLRIAEIFVPSDLGVPFHEAVIEMNAHRISLIFSDLAVHTVTSGHTPFAVPDNGPDHKAPIA
jgi:hypothetical protein